MLQVGWGVLGIGVVPAPSLGAASAACPPHPQQPGSPVPFSPAASRPRLGTQCLCWRVWGSELGRVSALCPWTSPAASGAVGLGGERGGRWGERHRQDPAMSAGSDLHGGAVPRAGRGIKGSRGPSKSPIVVGTRSWWDRAMAWAPLLLAVLAHSSGAMARLAAPSRGLWGQRPRPAARGGLCSWGTG